MSLSEVFWGGLNEGGYIQGSSCRRGTWELGLECEMDKNVTATSLFDVYL